MKQLVIFDIAQQDAISKNNETSHWRLLAATALSLGVHFAVLNAPLGTFRWPSADDSAHSLHATPVGRDKLQVQWGQVGNQPATRGRSLFRARIKNSNRIAKVNHNEHRPSAMPAVEQQATGFGLPLFPLSAESYHAPEELTRRATPLESLNLELPNEAMPLRSGKVILGKLCKSPSVRGQPDE